MTHARELRAQVERALEAWSSFPADHQPRPIVLFSQPALAGGFPDGAMKRAFVQGAVEAGPGFPEDVLNLLRSQSRHYSGRPLIVTTATAGSAEFLTDRGWQQLPAWQVRARDVPDPIWVLDPVILQRTWQPAATDVPRWRGTTARQSADGRTVSITFGGLPHDIADYPDAEGLESGNAIAILPIAHYHGPRKTSIMGGQSREVTVTLAQPLGSRVLLDEKGAPVEVHFHDP